MEGKLRVCIILVSFSLGSTQDPGQPLYLTPYIETGRIQEARAAAKVDFLLEGLVSYSGYLTVDKELNSNLFFWFFPSEQCWTSRPVILWLQGGPGASSLLGLLYENGPIRLTKEELRRNPFSWSQNHNVIYIDNPVGTGFSFTNSSDGYPRTQKPIGEGIYKALMQFFTLFSELKNNVFFLTGESYAGKYIPSTALTIHKKNKMAKQKINLQGLFIGNGLVDPINMLHYGEYLYQLGLIDMNGKLMFKNYETIIKQHIEATRWTQATNTFSLMVMDYYYSENFTLFNNLTGLSQHYNYINDKENYDLQSFVTNNTIRKLIHVGNIKFDDGRMLANAMREDIMKSMKTVVEVLLEHYEILFYNGQLDIICAYPLSENVLSGLQWTKKNEFEQAERTIWKVDGVLAGYCKTGGRLTEVMVRNAGHLVPTDQPKWALQLITNFTSGLQCS
ncbi:venom serine carboxypeptidase-like [Homalodisca vitripennis]|uniref:venom serine carboxypeptidase-like n=1 Tax=Homalodisca vitripennis TaxID=197043 RepID=UPI001EE9B3DB|nr:venom serine carboxypeptidase-like [Homalodisca vitripennis]